MTYNPTNADRRRSMYPSDADVAAATCVDEFDLEGELRDSAAVYAFWGLLVANRRKAVKLAEVNLDTLENMVYTEGRAAGLSTTDARNRVPHDKRVVDARVALHTAEAEYRQTEAVATAVLKKGDNLRTLISAKKAEMNLAPSAQ